MKVFAFEPTDYAPRYREEQYVHIRGGIDPEFLELLQDYAARELEATRLEGFAIKGKKEQSLFEFPASVDEYPGELFDVVAALCGFSRETMTLSERHIQAYEASAAPEPLAHKDRYASLVSVGLSIAVPEESRLVLYPYDQRSVNPFNQSAAFLGALQPDERPELLRENAQEVALADRPGDVVAFPGSSTWHLRRNSARSVNLYLKFNDFDSDPLGEDPATPVWRERTLAALQRSDGDFRALVPVPARRLDLVSRHYTRGGDEALQARIYAEEPFGLTEAQARILREAKRGRNVSELADAVQADVEADVRLLAERGAVDLLPAG